MNSRHLLLPLVLLPALLVAAPAAARPLTPEERTGLACASAFALVAAGQARGDPAMTQYPPLGTRGREYFVRLSAQLMDDAGLDRDAIAALSRQQAEALRRTGVAAVMPTCLAALDADIPPAR